MPYLITSYSPARNSRRGSVPSTDGSVDNGVRLVEGADQILAERMIDPDLAANRRVHLRQKRRRDVHERDAAQVAGGGESRHVADDAAAEGDERRLAIGVGPDERLVDPRDRLQRLEALAVRHEDGLAQSGPGEPRSVEPPDERARDHEAPRRRAGIVEQARESIEQAVAKRDGVAAGWGRDVDADRVHQRANVRAGNRVYIAHILFFRGP